MLPKIIKPSVTRNQTMCSFTVAIPHIAGYFGATLDEANWVITSYMVANAILLPLTA